MGDVFPSEKKNLSCSRCGICCEIVRVYQPLNDDQVIWWKNHGISPKWKTENFYAIDIPLKCRQLDGKNHCRIYDKRPDACKDFDCSLGEYVDFKERI